MATIKPLLAKILIQIGADEPKEIGTIEIPIEVSLSKKAEQGPVTMNIHTATDPAEIAAAVKNRLDAHYGI